MKTTIQAATAAITLIASSAAHAQDAVQWRVQDGGNGHWYGLRLEQTVTFWQAAAEALEVGAHLVTISSHQENTFVRQFSAGRLIHLGGYQDTGATGWSEPAGGWRWVNGEPWTWTGWCVGQPDNASWGGFQGQGVARYIGPDSACWDDAHSAEQIGTWPIGDTVIEWSADCNNDGIVDYGQCRDGTLPDYNGNNIPDCCERGDACVVGNYPVQWKVSDGGNGHWYAALRPALPLDWVASTNLVASRGAYLPTIRSEAENNLMLKLTLAAWTASDVTSGPFLGARRGSSSLSSACAGWVWVTGEPFDFIADFPSGDPFGYGPCGSVCNCMNQLYGDESVLAYWGYQFPVWNSAYESNTSAVVLHEWSADCNGDGIVDYGQILQGQLIDADANSVPDICEVDPCPGDITNGGTVDAADLSILLAAWGTNGQAEFDTDIDGSGLVDGGDLALVLGGWGPCPE